MKIGDMIKIKKTNIKKFKIGDIVKIKKIIYCDNDSPQARIMLKKLLGKTGKITAINKKGKDYKFIYELDNDLLHLRFDFKELTNPTKKEFSEYIKNEVINKL